MRSAPDGKGLESLHHRRKIMIVFGTRPEAIKMAPLCHALQDRNDIFDTFICVTAQHRHMLDQALKVFDLVPDIDLNLMQSGQDLTDITAAVLTGMRDVILSQKPDLILVHGDTTSALATAMAGFYAGIAVGHVEAGLRSHDLMAPFPEEFNRQIVSKIATWHFTPTTVSQANLLAEGVPQSRIIVTGNTVIDALHWVLAKIETDPELAFRLKAGLSEQLKFEWQRERFVLITGHRRENFGGGFQNICAALRALADRYPSTHFVYPVHLNPKVRQPVLSILGDCPNIHLMEPLDYAPFILLLKYCFLVLTDSGGIQEEAPSLGKPVLIMRDVSERPEAIAAGTALLVGANQTRIISAVSSLFDSPSAYHAMAQAHNPYGDGNACARIINHLANTLQNCDKSP
jgi:UDP-N-acetylglucosamine 2-epimerase (non-hydrolysing)